MTPHAASLASLSPAILVHLVLAGGALALGPVALLARKGSRLHRAFGYAWVTLMIGAAASAVFVRRFSGLNFAGFTPIHLFVIVTVVGIGGALWAIARRDVQRHRQAMWGTYVGACVVAGAFALLPGRYLGDLLWHHALGLI